MLRKPTIQDLRCECSRKVLLAKYGINAEGQLYIHVKAYKRDRILTEIYILGGTIILHCPECLRWHRVAFRETAKPDLVATAKPEFDAIAS